MQRSLRILVAMLVALSAAAALSACGGEDGTAGVVCQAHSECNRGEYCSLEKICAVQPCTTAGDCDTGLVCLQLDGGKFCGEAECTEGAGAGEAGACPAGFSCSRGTCIEDTQPTTDVVGGDTSDDVESVDVKVEEDTAPEVVTPVEVSACTECAADADCGEGKTCEQLGAKRVCLSGCTNDADCGGGWVCYPLTNEGNACVPASFSCAAPCLAAGCPAGQVCDQIDGSATSGQCLAALGSCGECDNDWQCGQDLRCSGGFCVPLCGDGQCPTWANCLEKGGLGGEGVMVCRPKNPTCCGDGCQAECTPACEGLRPVCHNSGCVQCAADGDCTGTNETCDPATFQCQGGLCSGSPSTPFEFQGGCVQCLEDAHCATGDCDETTHACVGGGDQCGGTCASPYPGCAVINGVPSCVPCTGDEHCPGGTCNTTTYSCEGGVAGGGCAGDCVTAGCPSTTGQFDLACDPESGCCYDTTGLCDNVEAFCNTASGSECKSIFEIFAGGAIPGGSIPGMEGAFVGGMCTCDAAGSGFCNLFPDNALCAGVPKCPEGVGCMPMKTAFDILLALTGGGGGALLFQGDVCMSLGK